MRLKTIGVPLEKWLHDELLRFSSDQQREFIEVMVLEFLSDSPRNGTRVYWKDFDVDATIGEAWNRAISGGSDWRREGRAIAQTARRLPRILKLARSTQVDPGNTEYHKLVGFLREWWRRRNEG